MVYALKDFQHDGALVDALGDAPVLVAAKGGCEEVVLGPKEGDLEETMVFHHETIRMMQAQRAEQVQKLLECVAPGSIVVPIHKKPTSFWEHVTIGRANSADLVLDDRAVSNMHAHLAEDVGEVPMSVQDLGSSNGTFVNRERLQPHTLTPLHPGDCLRIGQSVFYYLPYSMFLMLIAK